LKTFAKYFSILLILNGLYGNAHSQVNIEAGAGVTATIVQPVSYSKTVNTDFGNVALIFAGTVRMTPAGDQKEKGTIVLPVSSGVFTAATYYFTGTAGYTLTISYPTSPMIIKSGSNSMEVASFISDPASITGSNLIAGVFVSVTPSNVTVNYN